MTDMAGLGLTRRFYEQVVSPLLANVPHSACLLGDGSEVLGFDDDVSTDHDFGPRVQVLVRSETDATLAVDLLTVEVLPQAFEGFPVAYADADRLSGAAHHQIDVATVAQFFRGRIGWDPIAPASLADWLTTPTQRLATLVGGEVFHDPDGSLARRRAPLQWYPDDVWRYVLAASWLRISQEEAFIGRTGSRGDDLGSALIAGRVARDLIQLTFLLERCWAPYSKWLGTAFARLPLAATVAGRILTPLCAQWGGASANRRFAPPKGNSLLPQIALASQPRSTRSRGSSSTETSGCSSETASPAFSPSRSLIPTSAHSSIGWVPGRSTGPRCCPAPSTKRSTRWTSSRIPNCAAALPRFLDSRQPPQRSQNRHVVGLSSADDGIAHDRHSRSTFGSGSITDPLSRRLKHVG